MANVPPKSLGGDRTNNIVINKNIFLFLPIIFGNVIRTRPRVGCTAADPRRRQRFAETSFEQVIRRCHSKSSPNHVIPSRSFELVMQPTAILMLKTLIYDYFAQNSFSE